jgi:hypothetical protein
MDVNHLYSYFIDLDWLFLVAYSILVAGMLIFISELWPPLMPDLFSDDNAVSKGTKVHSGN